MAAVPLSSVLRVSLLILLLAAIGFAFFTLPIEKMLKNFLVWIRHDVGPWGPLVLAVAYIPLTILAVPASILTLGGGYLFGLPIGFLADTFGATLGATAAFVLGRTIWRPYVISKLNDYDKFQEISIATERSGFKIVLLLRLTPLLPFSVLNYVLSVTPISVSEYMLASWLGMMPITLVLVYVGTTLKDLADVTHGWHEFSTRHLAYISFGLLISAVLITCVARVAKSALDKTLADSVKVDIPAASAPPVSSSSAADLHEPLVIKINYASDIQDK